MGISQTATPISHRIVNTSITVPAGKVWIVDWIYYGTSSMPLSEFTINGNRVRWGTVVTDGSFVLNENTVIEVLNSSTIQLTGWELDKI